MSEPLVSIAMPFYNCERTLAQAVRSILMQSWRNWELLLCDDGSTDGSLKAAQAFGDPRIEVWSDGQREALGARLNECIARARGKYLARMDGDDIAYPERLERQVRFLEKNPQVDVVGSYAMVFGANGEMLGKRSGPIEHARIIRKPALGFRMIHPTFTGKTSWFQRHLYRPEAIRCEDHDLLYRAHQKSCYANLPEILLGYREERLDLSKIWRSRWRWVRRLGCYLPGPAGKLKHFAVGAAVGLKTVADLAAVTTGLNHRLLRHRAERATRAEAVEWHRVWMEVSLGC